MKYLIVFLLFMSTSAVAQRIRFTNPSNSWGILSCASLDPDRYETYRYWDTVTIGGYLYRRLDGSVVREDTLANIVYIRTGRGSSHADSVEQVLYDYNLRPGDTAYYYPPDTASAYATVESMDSVMISGRWYKVWNFQFLPPFELFRFGDFAYSVIEGIGCTNRFDYPFRELGFTEVTHSLACFNTDVPCGPLSAPVFLYSFCAGHHRFDNNLSCGDSVLSVDAASQVTKSACYPNPVSDQLTITSNYQSTVVTLYNMQGQVAFSLSSSQSKIPIDVFTLPSGPYILKLNDEYTTLIMKK